MNGNEIAELLTTKVMNYLDEPRLVRKTRKEENKTYKKPLLEYWFGVLPLCMYIWFSKIKVKLQRYFQNNN